MGNIPAFARFAHLMPQIFVPKSYHEKMQWRAIDQSINQKTMR